MTLWFAIEICSITIRWEHFAWSSRYSGQETRSQQGYTTRVDLNRRHLKIMITIAVGCIMGKCVPRNLNFRFSRNVIDKKCNQERNRARDNEPFSTPNLGLHTAQCYQVSVGVSSSNIKVFRLSTRTLLNLLLNECGNMSRNLLKTRVGKDGKFERKNIWPCHEKQGVGGLLKGAWKRIFCRLQLKKRMKGLRWLVLSPNKHSLPGNMTVKLSLA